MTSGGPIRPGPGHASYCGDTDPHPRHRHTDGVDDPDGYEVCDGVAEPPTPTPAAPAPEHRGPGRFDRWGPHTERRLAVVRPDARGWHLPVVIHQLIGGKHWSLALIRVGEYTKDPDEKA